MSGLRDELKEMSRGFRWGRRPLVPRSAEPFVEEKDDIGFPTDWARTQAARPRTPSSMVTFGRKPRRSRARVTSA